MAQKSRVSGQSRPFWARGTTFHRHPCRCRQLLHEALEDRRLLASAPGLFEASWRGYDTGVFPQAGPNSMAIADMNHDGRLDVVVGREYAFGSGVSVLMNLPSGDFAPPQAYNLPTNRSVGSVAVADITGDGLPDVLATIAGSDGQDNRIALWRNEGNGTLSARVEFPTGPGPRGLVVEDFDADGFLDVVTANYGFITGTSNTISLLRHNGHTGNAAGFLSPDTTTVGGIRPERVASADINGDGSLDLVVGRVAQYYPLGWDIGVADVLINNGTGAFSLVGEYPAVHDGDRGGTSAVALADLDNDGDTDLIAGGASASGSVDFGVISIRRNLGNGSFGALETHGFGNFVLNPKDLSTADLNGDGFLDVIAATPSGRNNDGYNVLLSNGVGDFRPVQFYPASQQTFSARPADVDRDGDVDIVTIANSSSAMTVHRNPGNGIFGTLPPVGIQAISQDLDANDVDSDGDLDIVTSDTTLFPGNGGVHVLRNNGQGNFTRDSYTPPFDAGVVMLRDFNGDNRPDILLGAAATDPPYHFATMLNHGNGTFAGGVITNVNACGPPDLEAADFDNDGDFDVVFSETSSCAGGALPRVFIFENDGQANFSLNNVMNLSPFVEGPKAADINQDGILDLVAGHNGIGVFLGNGNLTFQSPIVSSSNPYKFDVADMNRDGKLDVVMILPQPSFGTVRIGVALGTATSTFGPVTQYTGSSVLESAFLISNSIEAKDINRDGRPDVVVSNNASSDLSVFLNQGNGTLGVHQRYGAGYGASNSFVGEFTGDRNIDIATLVDLPPGGFESAVVIHKGQRPSRVDAFVAGSSQNVLRGDANPRIGHIDHGDLYVETATRPWEEVVLLSTPFVREDERWSWEGQYDAIPIPGRVDTVFEEFGEGALASV